MKREAKVQLTSSELGTMWKTYMALTHELMVYDFFKDKTIDHKAKAIITSYISEAENIKNEIIKIFKDEGDIMTTEYLLKKGVFAKPPNVTMPKQAEFIEDKNYMSGLNFFSQKRTLNTIEVGYLYESLEFHIFFMKIINGICAGCKRKYC